MNQIFDFFTAAYQGKDFFLIVLEFIAFAFGIISVIYAKKANILVYPTGIICTVISVYILYVENYFGDMTMNFYYSIMSIYGWWNWSRRKDDVLAVPISTTNSKEKMVGFIMFLATMVVTYFIYFWFKDEIQPDNYIDIFTSGIFFTAMWFMATKKLESWLLWIFADIITVPLYAYKGLGMLSLQYLIFTILAFQGYFAWKKSLDNSQSTL